MPLELVSFVLCPFVQRSVITLKEKGVDFKLTFVDLNRPPDWFIAISPLGRVPLLRVDGAVLFESQVINEYLNECHPPSMHPADPLERARDRGWIEIASHLLNLQRELAAAPREPDYRRHRDDLAEVLERPAAEYLGGPYWHGQAFSLLDAAFAPFFQRQCLLGQARPELDALVPPVLREWAAALAARPSVAASVVADFAPRYRDWLRAKGSLIFAAPSGAA